MAQVQTASAEQESYWQEFNQLKLDAIYVRDYRDSYAKWETRIATIRAITSSASIGAWAIWHQLAIVWATLIALSQVVDALRDVFPFQKKKRTLSAWTNALNRLFVDAQRDWDTISSGNCTDSKVSKLTHQLRQKMQRYEQTYIPDGLPRKEELFEAAQKEMVTFFQTRYP
jgi:hypothetical protein